MRFQWWSVCISDLKFGVSALLLYGNTALLDSVVWPSHIQELWFLWALLRHWWSNIFSYVLDGAWSIHKNYEFWLKIGYECQELSWLTVFILLVPWIKYSYDLAWHKWRKVLFKMYYSRSLFFPGNWQAT